MAWNKENRQAMGHVLHFGTRRKLGENASFIILLLPFFILFFLFTVLPVASSVVLSFFNYDLVSMPIFSGLTNYIRMFVGDEMFLKTVSNTLVLSIITGPFSFLLAFLLAWLINEFNGIVRGFLAFLFYAPALAGNAYFIWQIAFSGDSYGYVNSLLLSVGLITEPMQWFKSTEYCMAIVIVVQLWQSMGVSFLSDLAGLQNVNTCLLYTSRCV